MSRLPVASGTVVRWLGGGPQRKAAWEHLSRRYRTFYDRRIGAWVKADLGEPLSRTHYYTGRYPNPGLQLLIERYLRPGDIYVDIGAHHGIHALLASRLVGETGRVYCFEPHPVTYQHLMENLAANPSVHVKPFNLGLSNEAGELAMSIGAAGSVQNNLRSSGSGTDVTVRIVRGDEVLSEIAAGRALVKVDTEGFEYRVLQGMKDFLDRCAQAVVVEVTDAWLKETGSSAAELFRLMSSHGFSAYLFTARRSGLSRKLEIAPLPGPLTLWQYDVLFARPGYLDS